MKREESSFLLALCLLTLANICAFIPQQRESSIGRNFVPNLVPDITPDVINHDVNLVERTRSCLDFGIIIQELEQNTITVHGKKMAESTFSDDARSITQAYAMVDQLTPQIGHKTTLDGG